MPGRPDRWAVVALAAAVGWIVAYWHGSSSPPLRLDRPAETASLPDRAGLAPQVLDEQVADPPPGPPPPPAIIPPRFREYVFREGDTLEAVSQRFFSTPDYAEAILRANPLMDPARLRPGRVIRIPVDPENIQGRPVDPQPPAPSPASPAPAVPAGDPASWGQYVVQPNDTLSGIAQRLYGSIRFQELLYQANRDVLASPHALRVGQVLRLPPKPAETDRP